MSFNWNKAEIKTKKMRNIALATYWNKFEVLKIKTKWKYKKIMIKAHNKITEAN